MNRTLRRPLAAATILAVVLATAPAQDPRQMQLRTEPVRGNIHVLYGQGGNLALSIGDDGTFLVDAQYAPQTGRILAAIGKLTAEPVRFLVDTHWHFDHVGGNENLAKAGAVIVAHENVRRLMQSEQTMATGRVVPAAPQAALPVITFADTLDFHHNGERIHLFHLGPAHTDGDTVVHFEAANVFHLGDFYFSNSYPFLDVANGGNLDGMIAACDTVLARGNADARFIPGHGPVTGIDELRDYRKMLQQVSDGVHRLLDAGKSRDEVIASKPTAAFDAKWGGGFMQPDVWVGLVVDGIMKAKAPRGGGKR